MKFDLKNEKTVYMMQEDFSMKKGKNFVLETESRNIEALKNASEKYDVEIPDAQFSVVYCDGMFYFGFKNGDEAIFKNGFTYSEEKYNESKGLPMNLRDESNAVRNAIDILEANLYRIRWEDFLPEYLFVHDGIVCGED